MCATHWSTVDTFSERMAPVEEPAGWVRVARVLRRSRNSGLPTDTKYPYYFKLRSKVKLKDRGGGTATGKGRDTNIHVPTPFIFFFFWGVFFFITFPLKIGLHHTDIRARHYVQN